MPHASDSGNGRARDIPVEHRQVFDAISHEVTLLHAIWRTYRQLYAAEERVQLLNKIAPAFAKVVQDALMDDVLLSLSRLTDPPTTGQNRENLVLRRLTPLAAAAGHEQVELEVDLILEAIQAACAALRQHRNKRIAHLDLSVALQGTKLPDVSRETVEVALFHVRDLLNGLNSYFRGGPTLYDEISMIGDGDTLIACLTDSLRLRHLRRRHRSMSEQQLRQELEARGPLNCETAWAGVAGVGRSSAAARSHARSAVE